MLNLLLVICMLAATALSGPGDVSGQERNAASGVNVKLASYPDLVRVPDLPVYHAPRARLNLFFYDAEYWLYSNDSWYCASWYNGPWSEVPPEAVPAAVLRVPVAYYGKPPRYFRPWRADLAPRWNRYWGRAWEDSRPDWRYWDRQAVRVAAPPPLYQKKYARARYPRTLEKQQRISAENYDYGPAASVCGSGLQIARAIDLPVATAMGDLLAQADGRLDTPPDDTRASAASGSPPAPARSTADVPSTAPVPEAHRPSARTRAPNPPIEVPRLVAPATQGGPQPLAPIEPVPVPAPIAPTPLPTAPLSAPSPLPPTSPAGAIAPTPIGPR